MTQLELPLWKPREATPDECNEWWETELKKQGDFALKSVVIATIVQLSALGFMALMMKIIDGIV